MQKVWEVTLANWWCVGNKTLFQLEEGCGEDEKSDIHSQAKDAALAMAGTLREGSVIQQFQRVEKQERMKNRAAVKSLLRCTHFLVRHTLPILKNW